MKYIGDFTPGKVVRVKFNTHKADGTPITLAGSPAVSVYKNSVTQSTTGVTLTVDYDSVTGLQFVAVDTSADGTFYAAGEDYDVVITTGTVDSISVVGTVVGTFSLANRSALRPTTADRTLDVSSGGEAGIDLANVGSPATSLNLSGTTISTSQAVASVSGAVGSVTGAVGSVTSATNIATAVWASATRTLTAISDSSGITTLLSRILGTLASGTHNPQSGDAFARLGAPTGASIAADIQTRADSASVAAAKAVTDKLDAMLVLDGSVHQFTANALELAPSGGGGGTVNVTVLPGRDRGLPQSNRGRIVVSLGELITIARQVVDGNGNAMDISGRTLEFVIQDARGVNVAVIPNASITVSGTDNDTYSFVIPQLASARVGNFVYALNDVGASKAELVKGDWIVETRPIAQTKPSITQQPQSVTAAIGSTVTFSVAANAIGNSPITCQWYRFNGSSWLAITGATSFEYTTDPLVIEDDQAMFRCVLSNAIGSTTSDSATITLSILLLSSTSVTEGDLVTFSGSSGHLRLNGHWVPGIFPFSKRVGVQDAGTYRVYNSDGAAIGTSITLAVSPSTLVTDDFAGSISGNWTEQIGSPTVSGGSLQLTSGKALRRITSNDNVRFYLKFNADGLVSGNPVLGSMVGPLYQICTIQLFGATQLRVTPGVQGWVYGGESQLNYNTNNQFSAFTIGTGSHELEIHWNKTTKTAQVYLDKILMAAVFNTPGNATINADYIPSQCRNIFVGDAANSFTGNVLVEKVEIKQGQYIADQPFTCYRDYAVNLKIGQSNGEGAADNSYSSVTDAIGPFLSANVTTGATNAAGLTIKSNAVPNDSNSTIVDFALIQNINLPANHIPLLVNTAVGSTSIATGQWDSVTASGTASSATSTSLTDLTKLWVPNQFGNGIKAIKITSGKGASQVRAILEDLDNISNTATKVNISPAWDITPDNTSVYQILGIYRARAIDGVARVVKCLEGRTDLCVIHNGFEGDAGAGTSETKYKAEINAIVAELEAATGNSLFLLTAGFTPAFLAGGENEQAGYITVDVWNQQIGDGYASSLVPTPAEYQAGSPFWIHFSGAGYRTLGTRMAPPLKALLPGLK